MWMAEWRAVSARISGLREAGSYFFQTNDNDNHNSSDELINHAVRIIRRLILFRDTYVAVLPADAKDSLIDFLGRCQQMFGLENPTSQTYPRGFSGATGVITYLVSFRAEFEHLISDTTELARSLVIRAFSHLQRSIVADEQVRSRWIEAFKHGETACEALGACHLLQHGIWAFKTNGQGERTDLVLQETFDMAEDIRRASQGLVLTEWKLVRSHNELAPQAQAAFDQAKRYCAGILAGFEVASPRYLVLVSGDHIEVPDTRVDGDVTYEFRNVVVQPSTPSRSQ